MFLVVKMEISWIVFRVSTSLMEDTAAHIITMAMVMVTATVITMEAAVDTTINMIITITSTMKSLANTKNALIVIIITITNMVPKRSMPLL
jgi:hypothetical protein